jgi:DNA-binding transcriptional MerR regulator
MMTTTGRSYTSSDVVRLTGVSYRQLDYMTRSGWVTPMAEGGSGRPRSWTRQDVDRIKMTRRLLDIGVSWERLRADDDPWKTADRVMAALIKLGGNNDGR